MGAKPRGCAISAAALRRWRRGREVAGGRTTSPASDAGLCGAAPVPCRTRCPMPRGAAAANRAAAAGGPEGARPRPGEKSDRMASRRSIRRPAAAAASGGEAISWLRLSPCRGRFNTDDAARCWYHHASTVNRSRNAVLPAAFQVVDGQHAASLASRQSTPGSSAPGGWLSRRDDDDQAKNSSRWKE